MMVLHISHSDREGGAAIAAHRLVAAQRGIGIDAQMLVLRKSGHEDWVHRHGGGAVRARIRTSRALFKRACTLLASDEPKSMRSLAIMGGGLAHAAMNMRPDAVHLHWLGAECASLRDMRMDHVPTVWTCHDEWVFCGAEHYGTSGDYQTAYTKRSLLDPDRWTARRKLRQWRGWRPTLIAPSCWMAARAAASPITRDWPACIIPNTLPFGSFAPRSRTDARGGLGLDRDGHFILCGAVGGGKDPRKGFDLLAQALQSLSEATARKTTLISFGGAKGDATIHGIRHLALGPVHETARLAAIYNAANVFVLPSRQDNLPNTLLEAQACGTPCVAFDVGGVGDAVLSPSSLIPAFDIAAMADAIDRQLLSLTSDRFRQSLRMAAIERFGEETVATRHEALYREVIDASRQQDDVQCMRRS